MLNANMTAVVNLSMFCTVASIFLGLAAWALGYLALTRSGARASHVLTACSFSSCAISLLLQFFEIGVRAAAGDFSAILDTMRAVIIAACVLVAVTAALNIAAAVKNRKK